MTRSFLARIGDYTNDKARILTTIRDPYQTDCPEHLPYHQENLRNNRPAGQVRIRIKRKDQVGGYFSLLMVSLVELKSLLKDSGWELKATIENNAETYGAVIEKS